MASEVKLLWSELSEACNSISKPSLALLYSDQAGCDSIT